jgi:hypothetical protein
VNVARHNARLLIGLRSSLIAAKVAEAAGDLAGVAYHEGAADAIAGRLPLNLQRQPQILARVIEPVNRKIRREGILAQARRDQ